MFFKIVFETIRLNRQQRTNSRVKLDNKVDFVYTNTNIELLVFYN